MRTVRAFRARRRAGAAATIAVSALGLLSLAACDVKRSNDLVAGKKKFVEKCGACHVLARAGTKGTTGPNLDAAFENSVREGLGRTSFRGVVAQQVEHPRASSQMPPASELALSQRDVDNIAAYVGKVAAAGGKDAGALATAVPVAGAGKPVAAKAGILQIDADPTGQLAFVARQASAPVGKLTVKSQNKSATPHNIAIAGAGVDEKGDVVQGGGVSQVSVTLKAGDYEFLCTVPGHAEGGMKGKLTVK